MIKRVYIEYYTLECDCCGHLLATEKSNEAAEAAMRADGWAKIDGKDVCRLCQQKAEESGKLPERGCFRLFTKSINIKDIEGGKEHEHIGQ